MTDSNAHFDHNNTSQNTTGHEWDGISELNTPIPRWWVYVFYSCIIWAMLYLVVMPGLPWGKRYTQGVLGLTSEKTLAKDLAQLYQKRAIYHEKIGQMSLEELAQDKELFDYVLAGGASLFAENCAPCHGQNAAGKEGFPNLRDDEWIWGGDLDAIHTTLLHGIRYGQDPETRLSDMPAWAQETAPLPLTNEQINHVTQYVLSLSGKATNTQEADLGKAIYEEAACASCHGEQAEGNVFAGAPNLKDSIWLYGSDPASIHQTIANGRQGVMPAWSSRFDESTIKMLAVYIHSLGGGQ